MPAKPAMSAWIKIPKPVLVFKNGSIRYKIFQEKNPANNDEGTILRII